LRNTLRYIFSFSENIPLFGHFFFPDFITHDFAQFHHEILEIMNSPTSDAVAAPRGHGKSTLVGLIYLIWTIVNKKEKYIVYVSANHSKTVQFLDPIRAELKNNKLLQWCYHIGMSNVKDEEGKDREDCYDILGVRVEAVSFEKNLRGFKYRASRPTLIIGDDIETDERVINPDIRLKDEHKLNKIIIPSLDPAIGRFKMIGTILHWDCLLVKKIRTYRGKIYKACDIDLNDILWSELFTKEILQKRKEEIGSVAFASEFLNNPVESGYSIIKGDWIRGCFDENKSYNMDSQGDSKYLGCDFAFGDRVVNDKSAFVSVVSSNDTFIIHAIETLKGRSITEQFEIIQGLHNKNKYTEVVMEENSIKSMSKELYRYTFPYYLIWTGATDSAAKIKGDIQFEDKRHTVGKKAMILRLATLIENKKIVIPYRTDDDKRISNQLYEELTTFALNDGKLVEVGIHADIPIALAMAMERATDTGYVISW